LVPKGSASGFSGRYENLLKQWHGEKAKSVYTVKKGENLSSIAKRFNVSVRAIMIWNGISSAKNVSSGDKLFIFSNTTVKPENNTGKNETSENPDLQLP
jgi:LysM repeat protein